MLGANRKHGRARKRRAMGSSLGGVTAALALTAGAMFLQGGVRAHAAGALSNAEGDAYAVQAQAFLLGAGLTKTPIQVGPIAPTSANVPPAPDPSFSQTATLTFNSGGAQPLVHLVNVTNDTAKATLGSQATTQCANPLPPGFNAGPLTGGNACVDIASAAALAGVLGDQVVVGAVESQSLTQSCTATPVGHVNIVSLSVLGTSIVIPPGGFAPNTTINVAGVVVVVLNEQHFDSVGHGLTVNAIHIFTGAAAIGTLANVDLVIGHAHSSASCLTGTTDTGTLPGPGGSTTGPVPVVTKTGTTKSASGGEALTYTIAVDNKGCSVTRVTDFLPVGFHFASATGGLGQPVVSVVPGTNGQQQLDWFTPAGFPLSPNPITESVHVLINAQQAPGDYVNFVAGHSSPPLLSSSAGCGQFEGSDLLALTGGPAANQGQNPGVVVPRTAGTGSAATGPAVTSPNTGAFGSPIALIVASMLALGSIAALASRRRLHH